MKLTKLCLFLFSITLFVACKQEEKPAEVIETHTVEKETVIIKDTVNVVPKEKNGTSVKINSDGVKVDSKNIDVEVK